MLKKSCNFLNLDRAKEFFPKKIVGQEEKQIKIPGSWKNITIGHYDSSTIRYELS